MDKTFSRLRTGSSPRSTHLRFRRLRQRKGAATVELAIGILPVIALFLGTIDLCQIFFIRENVTTVVFEMTRVRARPGSTDESVTARGLQLCQQQGIVDPQIQVTTEPSEFGYDLCTVSITIPKNQPNLFGVVPQTGNMTVTRTTLSEQFVYPD